MKNVIVWVIWFVVSLFGLRFLALTLTATQFINFWDSTEFAASLLGFSTLNATLITGIVHISNKIDHMK